MATLSPYDNRTEEARNRMWGDMEKSFIPNKCQKSAEGNFYFYINNRGFYHIVKPRRILYDGEFSHYEVVDYLLTKNNTLKETKSYGCYKTREEAIERIES